MQQSDSAHARAIAFVAVILIALIAFGAGMFLARQGGELGDAPDIQGLLWPDPVILGDFALDDAAGGTFDAARLDGRWTLMFFGFTHCPDVCPTTLATLKSMRTALQDLPAFNTRAQLVFVSVDAKRDTPAALRAYVDYFDPAIVAATAVPARLDGLTRQLGILYAKVSTADPANYTFDHTASILLIGPGREFLGVFSPPHTAADLATRVRGVVNFMESR